MAALPVSKRLFLQALLLQPCASERQLLALAQDCCRECQERRLPTSLRDFVEEDIRPALEELGLDLARDYDPETGDAMYALINTLPDDEISQLATDYTPNEVAFFKHTMDLIMADAPAFEVSSTEAVQAGRSATFAMGGTQTQDLLDRLVKDQWLGITREGKYYLAVRTMLELHGYLEQFEDVAQACFRCKKLVTKGERCRADGGDCLTAMHRHCATSYFKSLEQPPQDDDNVDEGQARVCPGCRSPWATAAKDETPSKAGRAKRRAA